jgi:hypothetical protein
MVDNIKERQEHRDDDAPHNHDRFNLNWFPVKQTSAWRGVIENFITFRMLPRSQWNGWNGRWDGRMLAG